jgi:hypothetical protein
MSKTIAKGYSVIMEISNIGSIKPVASGSFKNDTGEMIKYKASIQFKTTNIEEIEDDILGLKEVESHIIVKIPCEDTKDVKKLNEFIRGFKDRGEVFTLNTTLPRQSDAGTYNVVSILTALEFIAKNTKGGIPPKK